MGKHSQVIGYRYYLGVEAGVCIGPVDEFSQLLVGNRVAWKGSVTASGSIDINKPLLYGGDQREGGVGGVVEVRFGEATQTPDPYMSSVIGERIPANRGIMSLIFRGRTYSEIHALGFTTIDPNTGSAFAPSGSTPASNAAAAAARGTYVPYVGPRSFYWAAQNPYIKPITPTVTRILAGWSTPVWYPEKAVIVQTNDVSTAPTGVETMRAYLHLATPPEAYVFRYYPDQSPDVTADFTGYALIDEEWVQITVVNDGLHGGYGSYYYTMNVTRGMFGTTPAYHADGALMYLYQVASTPIKAMNPAHILYQCLTDTVWGMGKPTVMIDDVGWRKAADTLYTEGFGLCILWSQQSSIEDFAVEILKHIDAVLDVNLQSGLYELRLVRNDYDPASLPVFDERSIISLENFSRPGWGETTNDLTVQYTDQATGNTASTKIHDLANIYIQKGQVVSQTHVYAGIQSPALAARVADRDLRALSTPLASVDIKTNRSAYGVKKGDPIKVSWAALGVVELVCRVIDIDYGTLEDGTIQLVLIEDIFALPSITYVQVQKALWQDPAGAPRVPVKVRAIEVPYYLLQTSIDMSHLTGSEAYPWILAAKPGFSNLSMNVYTRLSTIDAQNNTTNVYTPVGSGDYNATTMLSSAVTWSATTFPFSTFTGSPDLYANGGLALIEDEWLEVLTVDLAANQMTVVRGVLDSIPLPHAAGVDVWFAAAGATGHGFIGTGSAAVASLGASDIYVETGKSPSGESPYNNSHAQTLHFSADWFNPYPPANVKIGGAYYPARVRGDFTITWAGRNRVQQAVGFVGWTDASLAPESGVSYTLDVFDASTNALIKSFAGIRATIDGGSFQFQGDAGTATQYKINLYAVRGARSSRIFTHTAPIFGYGLDYGQEYGGAELGVVLPRASRTAVRGAVSFIPAPVWINGRWLSDGYTVQPRVSDDGVTWAADGPPFTPGDSFPIKAFGTGPYDCFPGPPIVFGNGVYAMTDGDRAIFTRRPGGKWSGVMAFDKYVPNHAVLPGATTITANTGFPQLWLSFDGTQFVLVWGENDIFTSPDASTWTKVGAPNVRSPLAAAIDGIHYNIRKANSLYVSWGIHGTAPNFTYYSATSPDLINWTLINRGSDSSLCAASADAQYWRGAYYAVVGNAIKRSADLINWTTVVTKPTPWTLPGGKFLATRNSLILNCGYAPNDARSMYMRTTDGDNWTVVLSAWAENGVGYGCGVTDTDDGPPFIFLRVGSPVEYGGKLLKIADVTDSTPVLKWPSTAPNGTYFGSTENAYYSNGTSALDDSGLTQLNGLGVVGSARIIYSGKHYAEFTVVAFSGTGPTSFQMFVATGALAGAGPQLDFTPQVGDVIGWRLDLDAGTVTSLVNNVAIRTTPAPPRDQGYTLFVSSGVTLFHLNVGQQPFTYPQPGYTAWED